MNAAENDPPPWGVPLYPNRYVWFVFLSTMDVLMTFVVLWFGGREANGVADRVLQRFGIGGMAIFKFALVVVVIGICEVLGRSSPRAGRKLSEWAVAVTCVPVVIAFVLLGVDLILNG